MSTIAILNLLSSPVCLARSSPSHFNRMSRALASHQSTQSSPNARLIFVASARVLGSEVVDGQASALLSSFYSMFKYDAVRPAVYLCLTQRAETRKSPGAPLSPTSSPPSRWRRFLLLVYDVILTLSQKGPWNKAQLAYLADNLALLPYAAHDEPLYLMDSIMRFTSATADSLLKVRAE